jgi:predicted SnoaL-like aldol condensation-catalyzing enzyme
MRSMILALTATAATAFICTGALAEEPAGAKAKFCTEFMDNVIRGGKIDEAGKYLTPDFKDHNARVTSESRDEFVQKFKALLASTPGGRPFGGAAGGGNGDSAAPAMPARTIVTSGDVVVFVVSVPPRADPAHPGQTMPSPTHFDVFKMRGDKIAEHWD